MLTLGTSAVSETAENSEVSLCVHIVYICLCLKCECQYIPFLVSAVLFWAEFEVWAMSELACGVTLAFTVSPLPFPFLSFFELPLGTSAMSFYNRKIINVSGKGYCFYCMNAVICEYGAS